MKKINFLKGMLVVAILFIANLTVFAGNPGQRIFRVGKLSFKRIA